jgi:DNA-binding NarL/FixJ family response regulator
MYEHLVGRPLTPRELQCLYLIAEGFSNPEIAEALGLTTNAVKINVSRLITKLEADNRAHAVYIALKTGLLAWVVNGLHGAPDTLDEEAAA